MRWPDYTVAVIGVLQAMTFLAAGGWGIAIAVLLVIVLIAFMKAYEKEDGEK